MTTTFNDTIPDLLDSLQRIEDVELRMVPLVGITAVWFIHISSPSASPRPLKLRRTWAKAIRYETAEERKAKKREFSWGV